MEVIRALVALRPLLDRLALLVAVLGLVASLLHHRRLWQRDRTFLQATGRPPVLPDLGDWPALPTVSVLVAAWNEAAQLEAHLCSFQALRYPHKELILCAGGTDATLEIALCYSGAQIAVLEQQPGEGKQRALQRCFSRAHGTVIYLTDADCVFDDTSFELTILPLVSEGEQVCSGSSRPSAALLENPFVLAQAAPQLYHAAYAERYTTGLLGRNCALDRAALEQVGGLDQEAPTGTDYVLAKTLIRAGKRIRYLRDSRISTDYPTTPGAYIRQQRRWIRNVVVWGWRFGAYREVRAALRTSSIGITMLVLPWLSLLFGRLPLALWLNLLGYAFLSRLRYLLVAQHILRRPVLPVQVAAQLPMLFLDFVAWSRPLLDYVRPAGRKVW